MTEPSARRPRKHDPGAMRRSGLDAIGADLAARVPPPIPPGLGESLLEHARTTGPESTMSSAERVTLDGDGLPPQVRQLVALARIEERQVSMLEAHRQAQLAAEARHTNIMQAIATFVPRSEIEKDNHALHERIDELDERHGKRLDAVEGRIWKAVVWVLTTVGGMVAGLVTLRLKVGL